MNHIAKTISYLILGFLLLMGILTLVLPQQTYSENENRILTQRPALSFTDLWDDSYQSELSDYLNDQFPLRDHWMMTATRIKLLTGQRDIDDTYIGKNHYYFEKILDSDIDLDTYQKNLTRVNSLAEDFPEIFSCLLLVPSAGNILTDKLPDYAKMYDSDALYAIAEEQLTQIMLVNPTSQLLAAAASMTDNTLVSSEDNTDSLYYHTDHHWTAWGAFIGYQALAENTGNIATEITAGTNNTAGTDNTAGTSNTAGTGNTASTSNTAGTGNTANTSNTTIAGNTDNTLDCLTVGNYTIYQAETVSDDFLGTLYSRTLDSSAICDSIDLPIVSDDIIVTIDGETANLYDLSCLSEKDQYQVYLGGNHEIVEITNCNGKGTLLIIKDSFANCLVPYLTEDYETIIMIDLRYYSGSVRQYLSEHSVDALLIVYELSNFAGDTSLAKLAL